MPHRYSGLKCLSSGDAPCLSTMHRTYSFCAIPEQSIVAQPRIVMCWLACLPACLPERAQVKIHPSWHVFSASVDGLVAVHNMSRGIADEDENFAVRSCGRAAHGTRGAHGDACFADGRANAVWECREGGPFGHVGKGGRLGM
eukprot:365717-Chlamydomonas_euryale.AAC.9